MPNGLLSRDFSAPPPALLSRSEIEDVWAAGAAAPVAAGAPPAAAVASTGAVTPDGAASEAALAPGGVTAVVAAGAPPALTPGIAEVPVSNTDVPPTPDGVRLADTAGVSDP